MSNYPDPEPCKHCEDLIQRSDKAGGDYLHTTGHYEGRHNCATDPYGYHAEPVGTPCRADGPNPCRGGRDYGEPHPSRAQAAHTALHDVRAAVIAIAVALGAALPMTPDVRATVGRLMDAEHDQARGIQP